MAEKLKFGFYWAASCGGCEIAVLDTNEAILDIAAKADIVFWPVAMDVKYDDVREMPDGFMDVCFFNGSVRNSEQEELAHLLRKKAKTLVAFGSCAHHGCIPGLANLYRRERILDRIYRQEPSVANPDGKTPQTSAAVPEGELTLPEFYDIVRPLDRVVPVDYYLPGCPPPVPLILKAVEAVFAGDLPARGTVLAPVKALCEECSRNKHKPKRMSDVKRSWEVQADPDVCFLEQGIICMGPATRGGCGQRCINGNWPCTGCMGPLPEIADQGARMISAIASIFMLEEEKGVSESEMAEFLGRVKDPVGTFYMYGLASARLNRGRT
ncbi:MAG: oxidoreductase [candidate division WOR-3 bacterium]